MPIYAYKCRACGHELEVLQKVSDPPLRTCPSCGQEAIAKQLTAAGFQLKGSGWYATDFKGSGAAPAAKPAPEAKPAEGTAPAAASAPAATPVPATGATEKSAPNKAPPPAPAGGTSG